MNNVSDAHGIRPYLPLIAFVIPTLAIGFGVVIPRSCIAGINELTVGFATTILGASVTYVAGQRAVLPRRTCNKAPLKVRLARALNRQAARPSGWLGRVLGFVWPLEHGRLNEEIISLLELHPGQRVLEVGSGTGHALREVISRVNGGHVVGIDHSPLMVQLARDRNRRSVACGEAEVLAGDIAQHPLGEAAFDRIFSVHSVYFWGDLKQALSKLAGALGPGGKLVLAFRPEGEDVPERFRDAVYRFPRTGEVEQTLQMLGLSTTCAHSVAEPKVVVVLASAGETAAKR